MAESSEQMAYINDLISGNTRGILEGAGWDALDPAKQEEKKRAMAQQAYDEAIVIARVFTGADGLAALEMLKSRTLDQTCLSGERLDRAHTEVHMYVREGQNSIVRWILEYINSAEQGPPK